MTGPAVGAGPLIAVAGLTRHYGGRSIVDAVSLQVSAGEIVAILGPNGAGKTTTVEIIEGYRRADGGTVRVLGMDPATGGRDLRARVGLMLQEGGLDRRARPLETLRQFAAFHAEPLDPATVLETVGLGEVADTAYRRLSGGERQRLGLALALIGRPEVLILDEPTAGLDLEGRALVRSLLDRARSDGLAVLVTSHDLTEVERLADRLVVMRAGRVIADGSGADLATGLRPRLRFELDARLDDAALAELTDRLGSPVRLLEGRRYEVEAVAPSPAMVALLADWCAGAERLLVASRTVGGTLEDTYMDLIERDADRTARQVEP